MNVSLNWLKEYVEIDENLTIKEIVEALTMSGSKVETYEEFGKKTKDVYTAKVLEIKEHPEEKSYRVITVDMGDKGNKTLVAKIPDIEVGDIVPVALPGASVIGKQITEGEVKGILSQGMICHIHDLGLTTSFSWCRASGLLVFPEDVKIGDDINTILGLGDYLIEFEITPNRPDCLSIEGLAKELAITYDKKCRKLWQYATPELHKVESVDNLTVKVESDNCTRYIINVLENVEVRPSSYDIQLKLIKCGVRPINNIVDMTNYIMLEMGQPLHAFDYDKLKTNQIVVRQANKNEVLETLDKIKRELDETNLVITNGKEPIAIAGVMGGEESGINEKTTKVVIEAGTFVRSSIRNTSKKLVLRTDASSHYEKGLSNELPIYAMNRVIHLAKEQKLGNIENNIIDINPKPTPKRTMLVKHEKINQIIGTTLSKEEIDSYLERTGIIIKEGIATIPYLREDLELTEDLSEEVARIYGYDKLNATLPDMAITFGEKTDSQKTEDKVKILAQAKGYNEIYTYTFFDKALLEKIGVTPEEERYHCVKIKNPLSKDFEYMRTTTIPHMLDALERNYTRKNKNVKLYELGKIFLDADNVLQGNLVREEQVVSFGMYHDTEDFYDFKEVFEAILHDFKILNLDFDIKRIEDKKEYHPGMSAKIMIGEDVIAEFGKLSPFVKKNYTVPENTYIGCIYFNSLLKHKKQELKFTELPKYPAVERDISFTIDKEVLSYDIQKALQAVPYVEKVVLFDIYEGKQIMSDKKSMAYRIYLRSYEKTLTEIEINEAMNQVLQILNQHFGAIVRS